MGKPSYYVNCTRCQRYKRHYGRGLCANCTSILKKQGLALPEKEKRSFEEWALLVDTTQDGCWPWPGPVTGYGYGSASGPERRQPAHVMYYERTVGPVPAGMTLDHTCHNDTACLGGTSCIHRRCVRPSHLEPVTMRVNVVRSHTTLPGINSRKTVCESGHPLSGENVGRDAAGNRICWTCKRQRGRQSMQKLRSRGRNAAIRRWAIDSGHEVATYGRIPRALVAAFEESVKVNGEYHQEPKGEQHGAGD